MPSDSQNHPSSSDDSAVIARHFPTLQPLGSYAHLGAIGLHRPITLIGSRRTARIHLNSTNVSRAHAVLVVTPDGCVIRDLLSREGTDVDGERITEHHLTAGQIIKIGEFTFRYDDPREPAGDLRPAQPMALRIKTPAGQKEIALGRVVTLVGKRAGSDVELPFADVSTANTVIVRMDVPADQADAQAGYLLYDLGGKGTQRNGQLVHRGRFRPGDKLLIGPASLRIAPVTAGASPAGDKSVAPPAVAERRQEAIETVESTEPGLDRDEIVLEEGLAEDSGVVVAEDLLGDSHVLEAIQEPEAEAGGESGDDARDAALEEALERLDSGSDAGEVAVIEETPAQADAADLELVPATADEADAPDVVDVVDAADVGATSPADDELDVRDLQGSIDEFAAEPAAAMAEEVEAAEVDVAPADRDEVEEIEAKAPEPVLEGVREEEPEPATARDDVVDEAEALEVVEATQAPDTDEFVEDEADEAPAAPLAVAESAEDEVDEPPLPVVESAEEEIAETVEAVAPRHEEEEAEPVVQEIGQALGADEDAAPAEDAVEAHESVDPSDDSFELALAALSDQEETGDEGPVDTAVATGEEEVEEVPPVAIADQEIEVVAPVSIAEEQDESPDELELADEEPASSEAESPAFEMPDLSRTDFSGLNAVDEAPDVAEVEQPAEPVAQAPTQAAAAALEVMPPDEPRRRRKGNRRRRQPGDTPPAAAAVFALEAAQPEAPAADPPAGLDAPLELAETSAADEPQSDTPTLMEVLETTQVSDAASADAAAIAAFDDAAEDLEQAHETEPTPESAFSLDAVFDRPAQPHATSRDLAMASDDDHPESGSMSDEQFLASLDALGDESAAPVGPITRPPVPVDLAENESPQAEQPPAFIDEPSRGTRPDPATAVEPRGQEDWRGDWQTQQSAFIGNTRPLDLRPQPAEEAQPKPKEPANVAEPTPAQGSLPATDVAGGEDPGGDVLELSRKPEIRDRPRPSPERPHRVGFGESVAEIDESEVPLATGPFSSAPVSQHRDGGRAREEDRANSSDDDYYGPLDPSGGMPETSGLTGTADVFSLGHNGPTDIPEFGTDPSTETDEIHAVGTATAMEAPPDEEVDGFLRTIRQGVGASSGMAALTDLNGHGNARRPRSPLDGQDDSLPEAIEDAEELYLPRGRRMGGRRRNGHGGSSPSPGRRGPAAVPATQLSDDERARAALLAQDESDPRRKFIFVPLLIALMVVAMIAAVVTIGIGLAPKTPVAVKLRYDIPPGLGEDDRRAFQRDQLMLLGRPDTRPLVLEQLQETAPDVDADFLIDPVAYNRFAMDVYWSPDEPDTLVLERPSVHPEEEMARLKAVAATLYEKSRSDRGLLDRSGQTSRQLQDDITDLSREIETLNRGIEELAANLPETAGDAAALATRQAELRERITSLDELWTGSDRRVAELKQELSRIADQDPLASDEQLQTLRDRLAEIERQLGDLSTSDGAGAQADSWQKISTQFRARPAAFDADGSDQASAEQRIASLAERLLTETLPAHLKSAAAIEMAREKAERLEAARYDDLLAADPEAQGLLADISLRERQLNAARADGIDREAVPLEMTLRILRNRLEVRRRSLKVNAANSPVVTAAAQELEAITHARTAQMRGERDEMIQTLNNLLAGLIAADDAGDAGDGDTASLWATAVRASLAAAAFEQVRRSPLTSAVWLGVDGFNLPISAPTTTEPGDAQTSSFILTQDAATKPAADPVALQEELARIQRAIERREAEIRGEIETARTRLTQQLAGAEATASKAQREAQEARAELSRLMAGRDSDQAQRQRLAELRAQKTDAEGRIKDLQSQLTAVQEQLQTLAVPRPPSDMDATKAEVEDKRFEYIIYAMIAISMLTLVGFFVLYRGG